jgi:hypothetical protein
MTRMTINALRFGMAAFAMACGSPSGIQLAPECPKKTGI